MDGSKIQFNSMYGTPPSCHGYIKHTWEREHTQPGAQSALDTPAMDTAIDIGKKKKGKGKTHMMA